MMKRTTVIPDAKKIQITHKSRDTLLEFMRSLVHFFTGNQQLFYIRKYKYRLRFNAPFLIPLTLFESSKVVLISIVAILMTSAKLGTLSLLKTKIF